VDGLIILTEWDEFKTDDPKPFRDNMKDPVLIDGVHMLGTTIQRDNTVKYIGMGVPQHV